ncbi:MAG: hypothetical protein HC853_13225 [Anaerolineae bacterium]|nr:hypothetical protein [Anaerolineae bacterium]
MNSPTDKYHRRSIRLPDYDYAQSGAYFITICTQSRELLFGDVVNDGMVLSELGQMVEAHWQNISAHFDQLALDAFVVMPNHLHGILVLVDSGTPAMERAKHFGDATGQLGLHSRNASPLRRGDGTQAGSVAAIVQNFKSVTTRKINQMRGLVGRTVWQRNYHERVIRDARELEAKRKYIADNPMQWALDAENPNVRCVRHS